MSTKVQANFHARIPTPNDQDPLVSELRPGLIPAGVNNPPLKPVNPENLGHNGVGVLAGSDDKPARNVDGIVGPDGPAAGKGIEVGGVDVLVEAGLDVEVGSVGFHVGDELLLGGVLGEVFGESEERELAEVLGEVEFEAVVGSVLPQRGYAVAFLEDEGRDVLFREGSGDG